MFVYSVFISCLLSQCLDGIQLLRGEGRDVVFLRIFCQFVEAHVARMAFVQFLAACLELGLVHIALFGGIEIEDGYPPAFLSVILPVVQFHHEAVVLNFPLLVELEHLCVLIGIIRLFPAFRLFSSPFTLLA